MAADLFRLGLQRLERLEISKLAQHLAIIHDDLRVVCHGLYLDQEIERLLELAGGREKLRELELHLELVVIVCVGNLLAILSMPHSTSSPALLPHTHPSCGGEALP